MPSMRLPLENACKGYEEGDGVIVKINSTEAVGERKKQQQYQSQKRKAVGDFVSVLRKVMKAHDPDKY